MRKRIITATLGLLVALTGIVAVNPVTANAESLFANVTEVPIGKSQNIYGHDNDDTEILWNNYGLRKDENGIIWADISKEFDHSKYPELEEMYQRCRESDPDYYKEIYGRPSKEEADKVSEGDFRYEAYLFDTDPYYDLDYKREVVNEGSNIFTGDLCTYRDIMYGPKQNEIVEEYKDTIVYDDLLYKIKSGDIISEGLADDLLEQKTKDNAFFTSVIENGEGSVLDPEKYDETPVTIYRLYNPNSGEHFYTKDANERDHLASIGWNDEGIGWYAPTYGAACVYRLYNPNSGDHHYTTNYEEVKALDEIGWRREGTLCYSAREDSGIAMFRQYNPNEEVGTHNYTANTVERDHLVSIGWNDEGIAWYGVKGN